MTIQDLLRDHLDLVQRCAYHGYDSLDRDERARIAAPFTSSWYRFAAWHGLLAGVMEIECRILLRIGTPDPVMAANQLGKDVLLHFSQE